MSCTTHLIHSTLLLLVSEVFRSQSTVFLQVALIEILCEIQLHFSTMLEGVEAEFTSGQSVQTCTAVACLQPCGSDEFDMS